MKYIRICILLLLLPVLSKGQDSTKHKSNELNWLDKNFFLSVGGTALWDFWQSPDPAYGYFVLISGYVEPRLNIINFKDKASLSANFPVSLGIGVSDPGIGNFEVPMLLSYNRNYHSTFNNIDHYGFSFGAGVQINTYPLFPPDEAYATQSWEDLILSFTLKSDVRRPNTFNITAGLLNWPSFKFSFGVILNYDNPKQYKTIR